MSFKLNGHSKYMVIESKRSLILERQKVNDLIEKLGPRFSDSKQNIGHKETVYFHFVRSVFTKYRGFTH